MSSNLGWTGVGLLVVSAAVILVELVLGGIWSARVSKRARLLSERLATERRLLKEDVECLQVALAETKILWQPYAKLLRFVRHPLAIALLQSYRRRGKAAAR